MYFNFSTPSVLWYSDPGPSQQKKCPLCGATAFDIQKTGKAGCAQCYETFSDILDPYIRRIHGNVVHQGRIPGGGTPEHKAAAEVTRLRQQLDSAVKAEDYLKAAELRDRIRELEGK